MVQSDQLKGVACQEQKLTSHQALVVRHVNSCDTIKDQFYMQYYIDISS